MWFSLKSIAFLNKLKSEEPNVTFLPFGSSLKMCKIAEGEANLYLRLGTTMEWDTAAAHGILRSLGYSILQESTQEELTYNKENLLNPYFICY